CNLDRLFQRSQFRMCLERLRQRSLHSRLLLEAELFAFGSCGLTCLGEVDHPNSNQVLASNCVHVSGILPSLLDPWHVPDTFRFLPDCFSNESCKFLVVATVSKDWFEVVILCVKEAREDFAVGGESKSVAVVTERFAHRRNHS